MPTAPHDMRNCHPPHPRGSLLRPVRSRAVPTGLTGSARLQPRPCPGRVPGESQTARAVVRSLLTKKKERDPSVQRPRSPPLHTQASSLVFAVRLSPAETLWLLLLRATRLMPAKRARLRSEIMYAVLDKLSGRSTPLEHTREGARSAHLTHAIPTSRCTKRTYLSQAGRSERACPAASSRVPTRGLLSCGGHRMHPCADA